ncbi:MAG: type IV pilus assembly protein PilE [Halieaceae bacterium]|jgi:type IV pilus assembly protein PilE
MAVFTAAPIPAAPTSSARKGCATGATAGRKAAGFSLIELMIVLVVLGILVAVAVPSYRNSIARSQRVDAQSALLGFSQAMERFFTQNYTFEGAAAGGNATGIPLGTVFSAVAPIDGDAIYNLSITAADDSGYTLRATPVANGPQDGDGFLQLDSLGRRGWDRNDNDALAASEFTWASN